MEETPKRSLLDRRIRGVNEKKKLFTDSEDDRIKFTQELFSRNQIQEIETRFTDKDGNEKKKSIDHDNISLVKKYQKVETDEGRILHAFFTPNQEDKLSNFKPFWINIGNPSIAKELVCIR